MSPVCVRCGRARVDHQIVTWTDGPRVLEAVLVCPTAIFKADEDEDMDVLRPGARNVTGRAAGE